MTSVIGAGLIHNIAYVVFLAIYFLPTIVAFIRSSRSRSTVLIVNLLLGWTFIGWLVALVVAVRGRKDAPAP